MRYPAFAKVNVFLKIVGKRDNYHEILSRFVKVKNLSDYLEFKDKKTNQEFELVGDFGCKTESNTIYKAYKATCKAGFEDKLKDFFKNHSLHVEKNIPSFAGLGGGSSDAAVFLHMINSELNLGLGEEELAKIGLEVGADVPFFVYDYNSANISGIGEIVEEFEEDLLDIEVFTPNIKCDTKEVYKAFRQNYIIEPVLAKKMSKMKSTELLKTYSDITLNDLFRVALKVYPKLNDYRKDSWFFSGSGSSFFRVKIDK